MSLILEALKKLERDKQVENRGGFLVMAARPWPSEGDSRRVILLTVAGAVALLVLGAALALWLWRAAPRAELARPDALPSRTAVPVVPAAPVPPAAPAAGPPSASVPAAAPPVTAIGAPPKAPAPTQEPASFPTRVPPTPLAVVPGPSAPPGADSGPAAAAAVPGPRFRLTAISERDGKPVAMINDRLVFEGDSWDDVTVVRIGASEVELKVAGKPLTVSF